MKKNNLLLDIYITFLKLGCFSFGGGYAMIPLIEREAVDEKEWVDKEEIVDIFAISESIPGAIAMNASAFVGYTVAGVKGAVLALIGNLTPPLIIVLTLSILFAQFSSYPIVQAAFKGIRPAIIGLILYASVKIGLTAIKDYKCLMIMVAAFSMVLIFHVHPILVIILGALSGILIKALACSSKAKECSKIEEGGDIN